jgi:hypothetical protein
VDKIHPPNNFNFDAAFAYGLFLYLLFCNDLERRNPGHIHYKHGLKVTEVGKESASRIFFIS